MAGQHQQGSGQDHALQDLRLRRSISHQQNQGQVDAMHVQSPEAAIKSSQSRAPKGTLAIAFRQLGTMLKRNTVLQIRYRRSTFAQTLLGPILFLLLLWILQKADTARQLRSNYHPESWTLPGITNCQGRTPTSPCVNLMFTPDTPEVRQILETVNSRNQVREPKVSFQFEQPWTVATNAMAAPERTYGFVPVPNTDFIYQYGIQFPNTTRFGIEFSIVDGPPKNYRYQTWFNYTSDANQTDPFGDSLLSFTRAVDEAIMIVSGTSTTDLDVELKDFPKVPPARTADQVIQQLGAMFFFCSMMVIFICVLNQLVGEKELHLRHSMQMMGLKTVVYWLSWWLSNSVLVVISAIVLSGFGVAFGFDAFKNANFGVLFISFVLFGLAMVTMAFWLTTMVKASRTAILIGIFLFIIGLLFQSMVFSNPFVGYIWYDEGTSPVAKYVLMFLPFFNFGKIFLDISMLSTGRYDVLTDTYVPGPGFHWSDLYQPIPQMYTPTYDEYRTRHPDVPAPIQSWYLLLMNIGFFAILTLYFDQVVADEYGNRRHALFFLDPRFYGLKLRMLGNARSESEWIEQQRQDKDRRTAKLLKKKNRDHLDDMALQEDEDADVQMERERALDDQTRTQARIVHLQKIFRQSMFRSTKLDKIAVKDLCLTLNEGSTMILLGQNGAGKTSSMNMLSGLTKSSGGDALFYGLSMDRDMPQIRSMMGVCPQHDILFDEMSAWEHIELYAGLKNVPAVDIPALAEERLKAVRLWKVKDRMAGTYSGGMKRRLSMVISTLGDPKIIFMDEPTTGMDPVNRRNVWSFIEKFKHGRIIVLTTHSMEEADVLGDRICIMAHGRLRAIGNGVHLKNKFGSGYRVNLVTEPAKSDKVKSVIEKMIPGAELADDSAGALIYQLPSEATPMIPSLVRWLEGVDAGTGGGNNLPSASASAASLSSSSAVEELQLPAEASESLIEGWGISQISLEDVFLRVIRDANPQGYLGYEVTDVDPKDQKGSKKDKKQNK
ncbi:ATP-binding cassette sub- A member 1 [Actinomortierella ambigua]|uniref:ATP-binding cassette sub- A member 1 n=1 Tax=Actinomortierella ambigua TaxID=1343610 RepID=A0A9P6UBZ0_9FUNG|nr:ATP-binding cassette sub- A member 1 [Actinomortierella ambigua]